MTLTFSTIAILLMILIPLGLAVWLRRRFRVPWLLFCVGMLTFVGSQAYHIPLNNWLTNLGVIGEIGPDAPNLLATAVLLGLSAGLSETIARVVGYWLLFRKKLAERFEDGVLVGLGTAVSAPVATPHPIRISKIIKKISFFIFVPKKRNTEWHRGFSARLRGFFA